MRKIIIIFLLFTSCINSYDFKQDDSDRSLVVEGYVSNNPGDSEIKLSWSGIFQSNIFDFISNAGVVVIENETVEHDFTYIKDGLYKPVQKDFSAKMESRYRLKIVLEGQVYESDPVNLQSSLDIDSLSFTSSSKNQSGDQFEDASLEVKLTTSIDENASRYYLYTFEETWLAVAQQSLNKTVKPIYIYDQNQTLINIDYETTFNDNLTNCWRINKIVGISNFTTEGLSRNQLINVNLFRVNLKSSRLLHKYSVLVNQYAISREAHHFFNMLEEFSENSGFLYDIQPGLITGNIHNISSPQDDAIGIFYAAYHNSSRIFKSFNELSYEERTMVRRYQPKCDNVGYWYPDFPPDSIPNEILTEKLQYLRDSLLTEKGLVIRDYFETEESNGDPIIWVELSNVHCIDCRVYGTNIKPVWWED